MSDQTRALRELISEPQPTLVVECLNAVTARVVQAAGIKATYIGGNALGILNYAMPDHGLITTTEMIELTARITEIIEIPLIADADQGGETGLNVRRTVRRFERAGAAGIHLEDTVNPKHMYDGDALVGVDEMRARIAAAVEARTDPDFVLIARTDELFNGGTVEETIRRGIAYAEEGADVFMLLNTTPDTIKQIAAEVPIPLLELNRPVREWSELPIALNVFTGGALMAATNAHLALVTEILRTGQYDFASHRLPDGYQDLMTDEEIWRPIARKWAADSDLGKSKAAAKRAAS